MSIATVFEIVLAAVVLGLGIWTIVGARDLFGDGRLRCLRTAGRTHLGAPRRCRRRADRGRDRRRAGRRIAVGCGGAVEGRQVEAAEAPGKVTRVSAAALSVLTATALAGAVLLLPDPAPTLAPTALRMPGRPVWPTPSPTCSWRSARWTPCLRRSCSCWPSSAFGRLHLIVPGAAIRDRAIRPIQMAFSFFWRACCRPSVSSSASISSGLEPIIPAEPFRAARFSRRCGCWLSWPG